jgi:hypothetical protein
MDMSDFDFKGAVVLVVGPTAFFIIIPGLNVAGIKWLLY